MTSIEVAHLTGVSVKSVRAAIHRGDLLATRAAKGRMAAANALEYHITQEAADDWKARRDARTPGRPYEKAADAQGKRRRDSGHAYFMAKDDEGDEGHYGHRITVMKLSALKGDEQARKQLRQPWERGGIALTRWWNAAVGEVV